MWTPRPRRINRRRLVVSSVMGSAAIMAPGQATRMARQSGTLVVMAQEGSPNVPMFRAMPGSGPDSSNAVEVIWQFAAGDGTYSFPILPVILDGVVYIDNRDGNFLALNAVDGTERWRFEIGGVTGLGPLAAVASDTVYVGRTDPDLEKGVATYHALNTADGTERWFFPVDVARASWPVVVDDAAYLAGRNLFAVNAADGTERWRFAAENGLGALIVAEGVVYAEVDRTNLVALRSKDGTERWRFTTSEGFTFRSSVTSGMVYVGSRDGYVYALSAEDGTERWRFTTDSSSAYVVDGVIYIASMDGNLYALNTEDGVERWRAEIGGEITSIGEKVDEVLCVRSGDGYICALSVQDGTERWRFTQRGVTHPVAVDGVVYFGGGATYRDDANANLYALNVADGAELWQLSIRNGLQVGVVRVVGGMVYVANQVGNLYAVGARVPTLGVGGTAGVAERTSLRGGPAPTAVERAELEQDTVVAITGEAVTTGDVVWWPVTVDETGDQGWVEASKLDPLTSGPEPTAAP